MILILIIFSTKTNSYDSAKQYAEKMITQIQKDGRFNKTKTHWFLVRMLSIVLL